MNLSETIDSPKVGSILRNPQLSDCDRVDRLVALFEDSRAVQRLASESMIVTDDGWNSDLRAAEIALQHFGVDPSAAEGRGAATL